MNEGNTAHATRSGAVLALATGLMAVGLVMVASTSASLDHALLGPGLLSTPFGRQLLFAGAGIVLMLLVSRMSVPLLESPSLRVWGPRVLFAAVVIALIAVLIPSLTQTHRGSARWLGFAPGGFSVNVQPSEPAKLAMVALLASILAQGAADPRSFRQSFLPASILIGACVLLVGKEDFGTSVLLAVVGVGVLVAAGCRWLHVAALCGAGTVALGGLLLAAPYRLARLTAYWDIWADRRGAGYQPIQSLATIADGGWIGRGLGSGIQKYGYLPESRTDFIFAVICEEMGTLGGVFVIALFLAFLWLGVQIMRSAATPFDRLLAFGLTATVGFQAAMNIAVVTVVAPTTGISLPFISAGGSGLLTFCVAIGLLSGIAARSSRHAATGGPIVFGRSDSALASCR